MGLMDNFTADATVELKHSEYYDLMKEASKAELMANAVKAEVPGAYIHAMLTGQKFQMKEYDCLPPEKELWGNLQRALADILKTGKDECYVRYLSTMIKRQVDLSTDVRTDEVRKKTEEKEGKSHADAAD